MALVLVSSFPTILPRPKKKFHSGTSFSSEVSHWSVYVLCVIYISFPWILQTWTSLSSAICCPWMLLRAGRFTASLKTSWVDLAIITAFNSLSVPSPLWNAKEERGKMERYYANNPVICGVAIDIPNPKGVAVSLPPIQVDKTTCPGAKISTHDP